MLKTRDLVAQQDSALAPINTTAVPSTGGATLQDSEALLKTAVLLLEGLSRNVMSGDVWALSQMYAEQRTEEVGLNPEQASDCMARLMALINRNRKTNPLHSMF